MVLFLYSEGETLKKNPAKDLMATMWSISIACIKKMGLRFVLFFFFFLIEWIALPKRSQKLHSRFFSFSRLQNATVIWEQPRTPEHLTQEWESQLCTILRWKFWNIRKNFLHPYDYPLIEEAAKESPGPGVAHVIKQITYLERIKMVVFRLCSQETQGTMDVHFGSHLGLDWGKVALAGHGLVSAKGTSALLYVRVHIRFCLGMLQCFLKK